MRARKTQNESVKKFLRAERLFEALEAIESEPAIFESLAVAAWPG
ncbi:hypothetical protein [Erythrobacter sp. QSSC1-22B]|nr:hypothetical protein [Erythrobacter sp. QSSC1-22B]